MGRVDILDCAANGGRRVLLIMVLLLAGAIFTPGQLNAASKTPYLILFGSDSCSDCDLFKTLWKEQATEEDPVLVYVCIDRDENYRFLGEVEAQLGVERPSSSFPLLLAGRHFVAGVEPFWNEFQEEWLARENRPILPILAELDAAVDASESRFFAWDCTARSASGNDATQAPAEAAPTTAMRLLYISSPGCQKCGRQERELEILRQRMPALQLDHYDYTTEEGQLYMQRIREHFGIPETTENLTPIVAWRNGYVTGRMATSQELEKALLEDRDSSEFWWTRQATEEELQEVEAYGRKILSQLTWTLILGAGLLDGINPCAFATIIFLVGYLLYLKRERRFVLLVGIFFCIGVFLSYFLYGVSLGVVVAKLSSFRWLKICIYGGFAIAGFVLFLLHLRDAIRFKRSGKVSDMEMGLNAQTHRKIHDKIHSWAKLPPWLAIPAATILGCVISGMELACTGQVYLPVIAAIMESGFDFRAFQMLLLYNAAFILPLILVTVAAYAGTGANRLAAYAKKHVLTTKIAMAILFLAMAVMMLWMALP